MARRLGLQADQGIDDKGRREAEEDSLIRDLLEGEVTTPEADEATCRRYYVNNQRRSYSPELFEAAHVLLPVSPDDIEAYHKAVAAIQNDPGTFADLARRLSACYSAQNDGRLG